MSTGELSWLCPLCSTPTSVDQASLETHLFAYHTNGRPVVAYTCVCCLRTSDLSEMDESTCFSGAHLLSSGHPAAKVRSESNWAAYRAALVRFQAAQRRHISYPYRSYQFNVQKVACRKESATPDDNSPNATDQKTIKTEPMDNVFVEKEISGRMETEKLPVTQSMPMTMEQLLMAEKPPGTSMNLAPKPPDSLIHKKKPGITTIGKSPPRPILPRRFLPRLILPSPTLPQPILPFPTVPDSTAPEAPHSPTEVPKTSKRKAIKPEPDEIPDTPEKKPLMAEMETTPETVKSETRVTSKTNEKAKMEKPIPVTTKSAPKANQKKPIELKSEQLLMMEKSPVMEKPPVMEKTPVMDKPDTSLKTPENPISVTGPEASKLRQRPHGVFSIWGLKGPTKCGSQSISKKMSQ